MDLKKKIIISLVSFWGIGIILALVFAGVLILQRNLTIPRVQASPGPACTVNDDLEVTKTFDLTNVARCIERQASGGGNIGNEQNASQTVSCNDGEIATGGGCRCTEDGEPEESVLRISVPAQDISFHAAGWHCECQRRAGSGKIKVVASVVCCF